MRFNDYAFLQNAQERVVQYRSEAKMQHQVKAGITTSQVQTEPMFHRFTPWFRPSIAQK